jgi:hypothetical protein
MNAEILAVTRLRFTYVFTVLFMKMLTCCSVRYHDKKRKSGLRTIFHCSQDERRTQKVRKVVDQSKQRENIGMDRFPCQSSLQIAVTRRPSGLQEVSVRFRHHHRHVPYIDVTMPPAAFELISQHIGIAKPSDLLPSVQALEGCGHLSSAQVYRAWTKLSEVLWRRDEDSIKSAVKLLEEFEQDGHAVRLNLDLPDGVTGIAWALPGIAERVKECVKEVALDATCESECNCSKYMNLILNLDRTNAKDLELYGLMAEVEGFGVPISYILLDTAHSLAPQKRRRALAAWLCAMRDQYGLDPEFVHTDKDFGEIGAVKDAWPRAKHQLCYWHLRKAVRERMASSRLSTAPYHPFEANREFGFINLDFLPRCCPNKSDPDAEARPACPPANHVPGPTRPPCNVPPIRIQCRRANGAHRNLDPTLT